MFDYFVARPDHYRLIAWGRLELPGTTAVADDPAQAVLARKIDQIRQVQQAGQLDPAWDPADVGVTFTTGDILHADHDGVVLLPTT
ncbi:hypothetical protein ACH4TV_32250 [Streptomyces sp. NPDC020898]|uniref:hypothetical protein n=1 Tax=Streptomyces sp. NPDC020898 TaxID=3365101 RepID=UPI0037BAC965